jgi:methylenetetrahydrofolate reductase (NADPH)
MKIQVEKPSMVASMIPQPDIKITDILEQQEFTLSAEIIPPRNGANLIEIHSEISRLTKAGAHFIAVTKGAGGSLRGGSLPLVQAIKDGFATPTIAHFTCRDLPPEEIENQLMDHHYFGVRNILALRGDPPQGSSNWKAHAGSYNFAYELVEQIKNLNHGQYLQREQENRQNLSRISTDFCIGVAAYPDHPNVNERIDFFIKKVEAGAHFAITQMLFDADSYSRFLDQCHAASKESDSAKNLDQIPILPGTRLLRSQSQALKMASRFGVKISKSMLMQLPETDAEATPERSLEVFTKFSEDLRSRGAPGLHIFVLNDINLAEPAIRMLNGPIKTSLKKATGVA